MTPGINTIHMHLSIVSQESMISPISIWQICYGIHFLTYSKWDFLRFEYILSYVLMSKITITLLMFCSYIDDDMETMSCDDLLLNELYDLDDVEKQVVLYIVYHLRYRDDRTLSIVLNNKKVFALLPDENVDRQNNRIWSSSVERKEMSRIFDSVELTALFNCNKITEICEKRNRCLMRCNSLPLFG